MPINPGKDETQSEWMARCVPEMIGTGPDKRPQEQAVAACLTIWRDKDKAMRRTTTKQPAPAEGESREDFMERCVAETDDEAACSLAWENRSFKRKQPEPEEDESREDFMDRCLEETDGDQEACELAWDERKVTAIVSKTHAGKVEGMLFTLSDDSEDRMGDIVTSAGWQIENFKRNPIALGFHNPSFVVGTWEESARRG